MGAANEKEKTQAIAYQRDFLGACWNSPYGAQEAQSFIPSRWCGLSQFFMEHNTGHKCVALQAYRTSDVNKLEEHLDVSDNATVTATTMVVGGAESFTSPTAVGSPAWAPPDTPVKGARAADGPGSPLSGLKKTKAPGLGLLSKSDEHLGSTIDLMLIQQRATSTAAVGGAGGGAGASLQPATVAATATSAPVNTSGATHSAERAEARNRSFSAASVGSETSGTLRRVVRDTQVVESETHNRQLYLRAYGLSVHQDVVFRAAPAHRRYDCIGLVSTCAPEELLALTSLRVVLSDQLQRSATPVRQGRSSSAVQTPRDGDRRRSGDVTPTHSLLPSLTGSPQSGPYNAGDAVTHENSRSHSEMLLPEDALMQSHSGIAPAGDSRSQMSQSRVRRVSSMAPVGRGRAGRLSNVGYSEFSVNPIHPRYNYQLTDTEATIPDARLAAAQGRRLFTDAAETSTSRRGSAETDKAHVSSRRYTESDLNDYAADAAPLIIGSISAVELQALPHNAEVCLGGWLYVSLEDEQKRLRRVLDKYETFLKEKQEEEAERERRVAAADHAGASTSRRSPMRRSKRPSRLPSPGLSPQRHMPSPRMRALSLEAATTDMLPPSALTASKTEESFTGRGNESVGGGGSSLLRTLPASTAAAAAEASGSGLSTPTPLQGPKAARRSHSLDDVRASQSAPGFGTAAAADGFYRDQSAAGLGRRYLNSHRAADDPLAPEDFWMPHAYLIIGMPMYECSISPTAYHTLHNKTKPVSLNITNSLSRETFGVGCITGIRYGGVIVLECREPVTLADKEWLLALKRLGERCQAMATASAAKAAAAAAIPRDLSMSTATARRNAEESAAAAATPANNNNTSTDAESHAHQSTPSLTPDLLERSVLLPYDAPLRDADLIWLQRKRLDKIRYLRRALRSKLRAEGFSVIFAYTRTARYHRRSEARRLQRDMIRLDDQNEVDPDQLQREPPRRRHGGGSGGATPMRRVSLENSLLPGAYDDGDGEDGDEDDDDDVGDQEAAAAADAQEDQDDVSSDEELEKDWDAISSESGSSGGGGGAHQGGGGAARPGGANGAEDDPFAPRRVQPWLASAAQDAQTPAQYTIKGTFRQIGGVRYFDTTSLLEGCAVRDVVDGVVRWARNLRRMPIKARPLSLFLQRYEGIAQALRIAQGSTTRAVIQALYKSGAPANVLLQANTSFSRTTTAITGAGGTGIPTDSFSPGMTGSFALATAAGMSPPAASFAAGPMRPLFPFITYYTGPLDPIVRAILSPEVEHMIRAAEEAVARTASKAAAAPLAIASRAKEEEEETGLTAKEKKNGQPSQLSAATPPPPPPAPSAHATASAALSHADTNGTASELTSVAGSPLVRKEPAPSQTIESMLAGPTVMPVVGNNNNSVAGAAAAAGGTGGPGTVPNASFTNASFLSDRAGPRATHISPVVQNGSVLTTTTPPNGSSLVSAAGVGGAESSTNPSLAGPSRPHVIGEPTVSNNTFILQTGACVQRPPERFAAPASVALHSDEEGEDRHEVGEEEEQSRSETHSSTESGTASVTSNAGSRKATHTRKGPVPSTKDSRSSRRPHTAVRPREEEEEDEDDGPPDLNRTLRLSQIALEAVHHDVREGRSQEWLDADAALRQVKAELEEMRFLVANADTELEQRIQEYVTLSSLFLPHTRVDQTSLVLLSVKMLRQFPDDVPVKELHSDWLPLLLATLTLKSDDIFVTERTLAVREHQALQMRTLESGADHSSMNGEGVGATEFVVHGQDNSYGHLMPPEDVCDANKRREVFNDPATSSKYAIEAIRPLPVPQPLFDVVIAPIPYHITNKTALALEQQGVDTSYSFCFTGGSVGVLAGVLRVYSGALKTRCRAEIERVLALGGPDELRARARNSTELLIKSGYNVFLRRVWVWGSASQKKPGLLKRLFGHEDPDSHWSEIGADDLSDDTDTKKRNRQKEKKEKKEKRKEKKIAKRQFNELDAGGAGGAGLGGVTNESIASHADSDTDDKGRRHVLPYRLPEAYALFDAIVQYLQTYRAIEKEFRAAVASGTAGDTSPPNRSTANENTAAPRKRRSFLQGRRSNAPSVVPTVDELRTEDLLVTHFEVCVATNYYYKRSIVEEAHRAPQSTRPTRTASDGHAGKAPMLFSSHRLLSKHEEQRRAHQLSSLVLRHTERQRKQRKAVAKARKAQKKRTAEADPLSAAQDDMAKGDADARDRAQRHATSLMRPRKGKSCKRWHTMAAEVEVPYCGGEENETSAMTASAKALYEFLETSLSRWREARKGDASGAPRNEAQDSCTTSYERAEMEKMVKEAVTLSLA